MKIIAIISVAVLITIIILTIFNKTNTNDITRKRLSTIICTMYFGVWIVFLLAYYFHNESFTARYASFDIGGMVFFWSLLLNVVLMRSIYDKKKYIALRILGIMFLTIISCIFH